MSRGDSLLSESQRINVGARADGLCSYIFQHGPAAALGEPYVYTYQKDDYKEMLRQIERARDTPIPRT